MDLVIVTTTETRHVIVDELYISSDSMETTIIKKEKKIEYDKKLLCFKDENIFIKIDFLNPNNTNRSNKPTSTEFIENNLPAPLKSTVRKDIKTGKQTQSYIELVFDNIKAVQYINKKNSSHETHY